MEIIFHFHANKTHFQKKKVVHLASFWKWGFLELGSGLFHTFLLLPPGPNPGTFREPARASAMLLLFPGIVSPSSISCSSFIHFPDPCDSLCSSLNVAFSWGLLLDIFWRALLCLGILVERPGSPKKKGSLWKWSKILVLLYPTKIELIWLEHNKSNPAESFSLNQSSRLWEVAWRSHDRVHVARERHRRYFVDIASCLTYEEALNQPTYDTDIT